MRCRWLIMELRLLNGGMYDRGVRSDLGVYGSVGSALIFGRGAWNHRIRAVVIHHTPSLNYEVVDHGVPLLPR